ncbi:MAG: type II toxin-antitoxin system PemK/MazF family toxin [Chitinophagales bacterium]|nr:type II toxin-antitoxin system PemK/MazF family toxin [Chitinophagales bacterium]
MEEGEVILTVLSSDQSGKNRPALILRKSPRYHDYLVCGISSQLHQEVKDFDMLIGRNHPDFVSSGLKYNALVRLFFLAIIRHDEIKGSIGKVSDSTLKLLQKRLSDYLIKK